MSYTDRSEQAQQEQLDWLHQIHEQEAAQTAYMRQIAQHTGATAQHTRLIYVLTIIGLVCVGIYVLAAIYGT